jgi:uncharacterized membrane protein
MRFARVLFATLAVAATGAALFACGNGAEGTDAAACAVDAPQGCPSWTKDVKPIIDTRCIGCHGPGGVEQSKFDYSTYEGAFLHSPEILVQVQSCRMPLADAGQPTPGERGTLVAWVECDAPAD